VEEVGYQEWNLFSSFLKIVYVHQRFPKKVLVLSDRWGGNLVLWKGWKYVERETVLVPTEENAEQW
jgi:hypothetical protein